MVVLELDEVEVDHCLSCGGIWLDAGELELLLQGSDERDAFLASFQGDRKSKERGRKCPICLTRMEKVLCGVGKRVLIDRCRKNDGIWLDVGELEQIIETESLSKNNKVLGLLEDMFGRKTV